MILANNPDNILEWEDFLDAVDSDPKLIEQLTQINDDYLKKDTILNPVDEKDSNTKNRFFNSRYKKTAFSGFAYHCNQQLCC